MHREYRALRVLWRAFPPAPRAFLYCEDTAVIGAPFVVMERRHGMVVRGAVPDAYGAGRDEAANRKLSEVVIDTLVDFHAVEPAASGLADLGKDPAQFLERQVAGWLGRYHRAQTGALPEADALAKWLTEHRPASSKATLLHNDWRLDNMALDPADPAAASRCTTGTCARSAIRSPTSARCSRSGATAARRRPGTNPMPTQTAGFLSARGGRARATASAADAT